MIAIVAAVAAIIGVGVLQSWRNAIAREGSFLASATSSLVTTVDLRLETVAGGLDIAARDAARQAPGAVTTNALDQLRALNPRIDAIALTGPDGVISVASTAFGIDRETLSRLAAAALERHGARPAMRLLLTPASRMRPDNPNVFVVSRSIRDAQGELAGIALVTMPIDDLLATVVESLARDGGRVTFLNDEFRVISRWPHAALGADLTNTPISAAIRSGKPADVIRAQSTIDGLPLLTSYASSPHFPFTVVMSKDIPRISTVWLEQQQVELSVLALLFVGTTLASLGLHHAVKRQLLAEQALRESERAHYGRALEGARDGLAIWNATGRLTGWNSRFIEIGGLVGIRTGLDRSLDEVFGDGPAASIVAEAVARGIEAATAIELANGIVVEIAHRQEPLGDAVTTLRDVTMERAAQRRIAESEARFRDGIESMAEGFILWDRADRMVAWNRQAELLLPVQAPLFRVGLHFEEILAHLSRFNGGHARRESWLAELEERRNRRERLGRVATFRSSLGRLVESVDRATSDGGVVSTYRDVTEQRQLLEKLRANEAELRRALTAEREMNAQQRRFVAMASHEFRTPLAIIDSAAQRVQTIAAELGADAAKRLERIRDAVGRMTKIIDRTLATARPDEGRLEATMTRCEIVQLAREVVRRQLTITPAYAIELNTEAPEIVLDADPTLLDHVITNLVSNAVKYSRPGKPIALSLGATPEAVTIAVADGGIGIPADELDQVFTRFFRSRLSSGIAGTGIGLHLVREFVAMHGGTITVQSEQGIGSTFTVRLPRQVALAAVA